MTEVRPATRDDVPVIVELLDELDAFYGDDPVGTADERASQVRTLLFGNPPVTFAILAYDGPQAVGLAGYSHLWPAAGLTASLYLKELYVRESHRRMGVGRLIMTYLVDLARANGLSRVEFTTDEDNPSAQAFYESLGIEKRTSKIFYRLSLDQH